MYNRTKATSVEEYIESVQHLRKPGKGSIQLPNNKDLPIDLIRRIIEFRMRKIDKLN